MVVPLAETGQEETVGRKKWEIYSNIKFKVEHLVVELVTVACRSNLNCHFF